MCMHDLIIKHVYLKNASLNGRNVKIKQMQLATLSSQHGQCRHSSPLATQANAAAITILGSLEL